MAIPGFNIGRRDEIIPEQQMGFQVYMGFEAGEIATQGVVQRVPIAVDRNGNSGYIPAAEDDVPFDLFEADLTADDDKLIFAVKGLDRFGFVRSNMRGKLIRTPLCQSVVVEPSEPGSALAKVTVVNASKLSRFNQETCTTGASLLTGFLRPKLDTASSRALT